MNQHNNGPDQLWKFKFSAGDSRTISSVVANNNFGEDKSNSIAKPAQSEDLFSLMQKNRLHLRHSTVFQMFSTELKLMF